MRSQSPNPRPRRKQLVPFVTAGYPTKKGCVELLKACAAGGADRIELGIPFSDPLADGPVIQATSHKALLGGVTTDDAFAIAGSFRDAPLLFMTYINPVFSYGTGRFFARAAQVGLEGVILPDVPPEEADPVIAVSEKSGVPIVFLISPTCTDARIRKIDRLSKGWIYLVSLKGVTGAKIKSDVSGFVKRVRRLTRHPLYVGFGISTPDDARRVAEVADGVVVGSALLKIVEAGGSPRDVERFIASLRRAID
ncbi:MAG TPA: tryptophan synthase subunit alpha [Planctomycetota bacterium]|nr:tryptophan synthase subunit alpha [Planctomycetota bacterium]